MLYLAGIFIDFFLLVILIGKKNKSDADKILACWLLVIGLHLTYYYLFVSGQYVRYPEIMGFEVPIPLLHGPFFYLYTSSLTNQIKWKKLRLLHFLPFLLSYIPLIPFLLLPDEEKLYPYAHQGAGYKWLTQPLNILFIISGVVYLVLSLIKLSRHRKNISEQFSNTDRINLAWLQYLVIGMTCIWVIVIFGTDEILFTAVAFFIFFIGYFGIKQTDIFSKNPAQPDEPVVLPIVEIQNNENQELRKESSITLEKGKYQKSTLTENDLLQIHHRLTTTMKNEKLYTNPELTLGETAQQINIHPNILSQVINSVAKKNFYDFINHQRVEEFIRLVMLPENQKFTLLSLAFECGFNSKTSFNRNFRKVMGLSPSDFLKQKNVVLKQAS